MQITIFSILLPHLSCQLSSHNSIFFLTDLPCLHSKTVSKSTIRSIIFYSWGFADGQRGQSHRKAQDCIKFLTFRSQSAYLYGTTRMQKNPTKNQNQTKKSTHPNKKTPGNTALHNHWGLSPFYTFLKLQWFWQDYYMLPFWLPRPQEELSMYSPHGSRPHTYRGVPVSTWAVTAQYLTRSKALCSLSHCNLLM